MGTLHHVINMLHLFFRCDSITLQLPLSVSQWVSEWFSGSVIDSFRFLFQSLLLVCGPRLTHVDPSGLSWTQLDPGGPGGPGGPKWTQVDPGEPKWTQVDPSGPRLTQVDPG